MSVKRSPIETRSLILNAANRVVLERGIQQLTLEAVAQVAGVSKGGLLYHFPSKDALIEGMLEAYLADFEARLEANLSGDTPKAWLRAYVLASMDSPPEEIALNAALLAAVSINRALLNPMRERYALWQARLDQMENQTTATLIRLALDGLWFSDLVGLAPLNEEQRKALLIRLLQMLD